MSPDADRSAESRLPTPVVTAFVWDGQRVLLALRSERVSTFPRHWAGISGYLEGDDPAAWARVEIEEETGIPRGQLTLRRIGPPIPAGDGESETRFLVHPFLFSVPGEIPVRHDWEAVRLEWVDVDELLQHRRQPVVPRLFDAFAAVWPPWEATTVVARDGQLAFRDLKRDRSMGAGTLARAAGAEIVKLAQVFSAEPFAALREALRSVIDELARVRPSMVSPRNLMADFRDALDRARGPADFVYQARYLLQQSQDAESQLAEQVARRIEDGSCVITISYSSTVLRALSAAARRLKRVIVCEARPLCEGRQLATRLREAGIPVTLITEAQAPARVEEADLVLLGADCVLPGRGVINKSGSGLLALVAHRVGRPVLVAAESLKWVREPADFSIELEEGAPGEVWSEAPAGLDVANVYFELVPESWITEILRESASMPPPDGRSQNA